MLVRWVKSRMCAKDLARKFSTRFLPVFYPKSHFLEKVKSFSKKPFTSWSKRQGELFNAPWESSSYALMNQATLLGAQTGSSKRMASFSFPIYMEVGFSTLHPIHPSMEWAFLRLVIRTAVGRKEIPTRHDDDTVINMNDGGRKVNRVKGLEAKCHVYGKAQFFPSIFYPFSTRETPLP